MKISSDCIRAPFCVRQFVRDLKKTVKEKVSDHLSRYHVSLPYLCTGDP